MAFLPAAASRVGVIGERRPSRNSFEISSVGSGSAPGSAIPSPSGLPADGVAQLTAANLAALAAGAAGADGRLSPLNSATAGAEALAAAVAAGVLPGGVPRSPEDLDAFLNAIGAKFAQLGISVDLAVQGGLLNGLNPAMVQALTSAHSEELHRIHVGGSNGSAAGSPPPAAADAAAPPAVAEALDARGSRPGTPAAAAAAADAANSLLDGLPTAADEQFDAFTYGFFGDVQVRLPRCFAACHLPPASTPFQCALACSAALLYRAVPNPASSSPQLLFQEDDNAAALLGGLGEELGDDDGALAPGGGLEDDAAADGAASALAASALERSVDASGETRRDPVAQARSLLLSARDCAAYPHRRALAVCHKCPDLR